MTRPRTANADDASERVFALSAGYFALLCEPTRIRVLHALYTTERTIDALVDATGCNRSTVAQHLDALCRSNGVSRRQVENVVLYGISDPALKELCQVVSMYLHDRSSA